MSRVREERSGFRRPTNVSLDAEMVEAARKLGLNVSRACEEGLAREIKKERGRRWLEENAASIEASNAWVVEHGLPLEKYRLF